MIVVGIVGILFFGWGTYQDFFSPRPEPLAESELTYFNGRAEQTAIVPMQYAGMNLRIWLEGHPVAYQKMKFSDDKHLDREAFARIEPGTEIVVGVKTATVNQPGVDRRLNQPFLMFVTLEADKKQILSLAGYNAQRAEAAKPGVVQPLLSASGLGLVAMGIALLRASSKKADHERAIRELVIRRQAEIAESDPDFRPDRSL